MDGEFTITWVRGMAKAPEYTRRGGASAGILRVLRVVDGVIAKFEAAVLSLSVMVMAANSIANVVSRQFLGQSIFFTEELNRFLIVMVTFIGVSYAARQGRHIRMSAFYDQLTDRMRRYLMVFIATLTAVIMFALAYYALVYLLRLIDFGRVTPALQVPMYYVYAFVPLGLFMTGIQYTLTAVRNLLDTEIYISFSKVDAYDETHSGQSTS